MIEALAWIFITSVSILAVSAMLKIIHTGRWSDPVVVACYPKDPRVEEPLSSDGRIIFKAPRSVILAQADADRGWAQTVPLDYRVRIPRGYTGLLTGLPGSFQMSNGRTHFDVVTEPKFLPSGWEGDISILLMNRNNSESAVCEEGMSLAALYLLPADSQIRVRGSIA